MSTIMKALRRLEQDQDRQVEVERLHGEVVAPAPETRSVWVVRGLVIALLAVVALGTGAGAYLWLGGRDTGTEELAAASAPAVGAGQSTRREDRAAERPDVAPKDSMAVRAGAAPARERSPTAAKSAAPASPSGVAVVVPVPTQVAAAAPPPATTRSRQRTRERAGEGRAAQPAAAAQASAPESAVSTPAQQSTPAAAATRSVRRVEDLPVAPVPAATPAPKQVARVAEPRPIETLPKAKSAPAPAREPATRSSAKPAAPPPTAPTTKVARAEPAPKSSPTPAQEVSLDPLPELTVVKTVWHPRAERRIVHVRAEDGQILELHEGDVYQGLSVREIKLSGVTFEHDGITISRRIGN